MTLDQRNAMDAAALGSARNDVLERGTWVAQSAAAGRYGTASAPHEAMMAALRANRRPGSKVARKRELGGDLTGASRAGWDHLRLAHLSAKRAIRFERPGVQIRGSSASRFPQAARRRTATSFEQRHPINIDDTGQDHG
jgi:2-oxo-4-hydroxy-4-carboxy--5-ureidoimidazoline (OHCU) decarboxylase